MIDIYADGADLATMKLMRKNPLIKGYTTNPSICAAAGISDYKKFCHEAIEIAEGLPISFEVFSDEWDDMERQARLISSWGANVNVKIPVTNTRGESAVPLIQKLSNDGIKCNVTAVFTLKQADRIISALNPKYEAIISIFSGRIADTGVDPMPIMNDAVRTARKADGYNRKFKVLWASPREVLNITQAAYAGCQIITVTPDLLKKYETNKGKNLEQFSLETVAMFYNDAQKAGYKL